MDIATKQVPPLSGTPPATLADAASNAFVTQVATAVYLNALSGQSVPPGIVRMTRVSDSNNALSTLAIWIVYTADGGILDVTGTTTQGLQEAINYAAARGHDLVVDGGTLTAASAFGAYDGQDASIIVCTTTVTFPPLQKCSIILRSVSLVSSAAIGVLIDSAILAQIDLCWGGQVVMSSNNAVAVKFSPRNQVPQDSLFGTGIGGSCHFRTGSLVVPTGGTGQCVQFDRSAGAGPIADSNSFYFSELNGGAVGLLVTDGATAFTNNYITAYQVHAQTSACIQLGQTNDGHTHLIHSNQIFADLHPNNAAAVAFDVWASRGNYANLSIDGTGAVGIKLEVTSDGWIVDCPHIVGMTTAISDLSTSHGNVIRTHGDHAAVDLNNSNQTGIATATWTKVLFGTVIDNTNATWDNVNHRWLPGEPGIAHIDAQVAWAVTTDQATLRIGLYINGALMRGGEGLIVSSGVGGGQGARISKSFRVANTTDYFEIWARQETGVNQDISGDINESWVNFTRLSA